MFITLEGPEGSGKTSQIAPLAEFLRQQGCAVFLTREPGGTVIGDQVRNVLMRLDNKSMYPRTEALLFCAARAQLIEEIIRPELAQGKMVISDRYVDSTLAYQGYGHGLERDQLRQLLNFATGGLWPDLTILLDMPVEDGLKRKLGAGEWNRMDAYNLAFHQRVRAGYLEMAQADPHRWLLIDASQPKELVQTLIRQAVMNRLAELRK